MSKRIILISWLILLLSACTQQAAVTSSPEVQSTQPAPSKALGSESTSHVSAWTSDASTQVASWTQLAGTKDANVRPTLTATETAVASATAAFSVCPGAPGPYAAIGRQVTVVSEDIDKLKLRSTPEISPANVLRELNRFTQMMIVGGPACVHSGEASYWFWQVRVDGEIGWVAEGDVQHAFMVVSVGGLYSGSTAAADTAMPASPCGARAPISDGVEVIVMTDNSDKLKLRSEPKISPDTVIAELDQSTRLQIVGGPTCVQSEETGYWYWLWKVKVMPNGRTGWIAQGDERNEYIYPMIPP